MIQTKNRHPFLNPNDGWQRGSIQFNEVGDGLKYVHDRGYLHYAYHNIIQKYPEFQPNHQPYRKRRRLMYTDTNIYIDDIDDVDDRDIKPTVYSTFKSTHLPHMTHILNKYKVCNLEYARRIDELSKSNYVSGVYLPEWPIIQREIQRWILPWTESTRRNLYDTINEYSRINGMIGVYVRRINRINMELGNSNILMSPAALTSGGIAFYGSIGLSLLETHEFCSFDSLFDFTALYLLTDHWMDNLKMNLIDKSRLIDKMISLVEFPKMIEGQGDISGLRDMPVSPGAMPVGPSVLKILTERYIRLLECIPSSRQILKDTFYAELASVKLQKRDDLSLETYFKICEAKGATMLQSMQAICGSFPDRSGYYVGACIQLIDDIHDIDEDINDGINTIATHILKVTGNLDLLVFYTISLMDEFDPKHTLFRPFILGMMMHSISIIPHFSREIHEVCKPFFPFDSTYDLRGTIYDQIIKNMCVQ